MTPTKKSIRSSLPRFDELRREYRTHNQYGICPGRTFSAAYADLDEDGNVSNISIYAVGDGMPARHYYDSNYDTVVDITDQIQDAIEATRMGDYGYDARTFRSMIIEEIQDAIVKAREEADHA
jgi:hypothetical protein